MKIDAHQHFWQLSRGDYGWLTPELTTLYHDFLPEQLIPMLKEASIDATVVVQAAPTIDETNFLLSLAEQSREIAGVVGWVDFESESAVGDIETLARNEYFVGVRPMIQDIADIDWMLNPAFSPVFEKLEQHQLTFDALVKPEHLDNLHKLLQRHPKLTTVIDHAAKPDIANKSIDEWKGNMTRLAKDTQAFCKLSGLATEASENWLPEDLKPYVDVLLNTFGPERLIWGSDWPVCLLATDYKDWHDLSKQLLSVSEKEEAMIFGENAAKAYKLTLV
jgi:L-fuconolactonase